MDDEVQLTAGALAVPRKPLWDGTLRRMRFRAGEDLGALFQGPTHLPHALYATTRA